MIFFKQILGFLAACLFSITMASAQVTVTYKVDISNYLAGGATLGVGGIRIGGNFGALNSPLPDWMPSAVQCGMSNTGNNVWSISVTYPATSVGETQFYKFVNNDWGTNEGVAGSTIATGGCGVDDGAGNINRTFVIPASNATVCFFWDACTSCQQSGTLPTATTLSPATAITDNSATVGGSSAGTGITARGICYATTQNPTIANSSASSGNGAGDFNSNLGGLMPATTYYARAFATNSSGTGYGNQISFTTLPSLDIVATTGTSSNLGSTTADVSGFVSGTNITSRGICFSTSQNPTMANSVANAGTGSGSFTANLTGLTPSTNYYARAFGSGPAGTSYGNQISFTTQAAQPLGITITFKVDISNYLTAGNTLGANGIRIAGNFADRGATVNGNAMANWTPSDPFSGMNDEGNNIWSTDITFPSNSTGQTLTYKFVNNDWGTNEGTDPTNTIVSGGCGVDDGTGNVNRTLVIPASVQTLEFCWDKCTPCAGTPSAPIVTSAAAATAITSNSASISGTATGTGITARGVCYGTSQNPSIANTVSNAGTGEGSFTANLSGLSPATLYYARAFATNASGTSYGSEISFTTQPGTPVQTVNVTYKVDVTNYIAAGNTIAGNGIRIAGNFADRGAKVNGTAMVNWTPTDTASRMTNTGNNIWSITVTYADSSVGKTQQYKFVNGNWGNNEGGIGSGIVTGNCGVDDGGGNINRTYVITSTTQTLTYCWDQCVACTTASAPVVTTAASATAITANSASLDGTATGTGITARGVCYGTTQNPSIANTVSNAGTGEGSFTANLSGLSPATFYYARAFATNATGTSYGSEISFTTLPAQVQGVNVTFKVDVTNYIAGGSTIGAGGIRIAGNFADRGAKVNGTNMVNWTPTDAASAMTNTGNNIWSIAITYPDSSIAKTQTYKFVNNDWGTNEGTDPLNNIASGGCGVDDGTGNINRTLVIPSANSNLTYCWDQCTSTCVVTSLEEINLPTTTAAYPNPFSSNLIVESRNAGKFRLISVLGKVVMEGQLNLGKNSIETSSLGNGLYILSSDGQSIQRLLKK